MMQNMPLVCDYNVWGIQNVSKQGRCEPLVKVQVLSYPLAFHLCKNNGFWLRKMELNMHQQNPICEKFLGSNKIRIWRSQIRLSYLEHPRRFFRLKTNHYFQLLDFHALHSVVSSKYWNYSAHFSLFENSQELLNCWQWCCSFWQFQYIWKNSENLKRDFFKIQRCRIVRGFAPYQSTILTFENFAF